MADGSVTVSTIGKTETYELNGVFNTVGQAVDKFYNVAEGGEIPAGTQLQIGANSYDPDDDTARDTTLRGGDVLMLFTPEVAAGGVKGN